MKPQALFACGNKSEQIKYTGESVPKLSRRTGAAFIGRSIAALAIAAGLAATPARADDFDRMIAAFDCSMIAKYATTEADSARLFEIGKNAGVRKFQKQTDLFVELPRDQAVYFSLGSWWAARAQFAISDATKQGQTDFGEGFQLNSPEGFKLMREQYRVRNCGLIGETGDGPARAADDLISGPAVARLPRSKP